MGYLRVRIPLFPCASSPVHHSVLRIMTSFDMSWLLWYHMMMYGLRDEMSYRHKSPCCPCQPWLRCNESGLQSKERLCTMSAKTDDVTWRHDGESQSIRLTLWVRRHRRSNLLIRSFANTLVSTLWYLIRYIQWYLNKSNKINTLLWKNCEIWSWVELLSTSNLKFLVDFCKFDNR